MGHPGFAIGHPRHGRTDRLAVAARPLSRLEHKRQASDRQVYRNGADDGHAHLINKLKVV